MEPVVSGMATLIGYIGDFVTGCVSWMGQIFTFVTTQGHELALLAFVAVWAGLAVHWFKMLTRG